MAKRVNKWLYGWNIWTNYGYGWEIECSYQQPESTYASVMHDAREYRLCPQHPQVKVTRTRFPNPEYKEA